MAAEKKKGGTEKWSLQQYKDFMAKGGQVGGGEKKKRKKGDGAKAKADIEYTLRELGVKYVKEFEFALPRKFRFDYYIPALRLGIEYEGIMSAKARHTSVVGYTRDTEKYNLAQSLEYTVLRYTAINVGNLKKDLLKLL